MGTIFIVILGLVGSVLLTGAVMTLLAFSQTDKSKLKEFLENAGISLICHILVILVIAAIMSTSAS